MIVWNKLVQFWWKPNNSVFWAFMKYPLRERRKLFKTPYFSLTVWVRLFNNICLCLTQILLLWGIFFLDAIGFDRLTFQCSRSKIRKKILGLSWLSISHFWRPLVFDLGNRLIKLFIYFLNLNIYQSKPGIFNSPNLTVSTNKCIKAWGRMWLVSTGPS